MKLRVLIAGLVLGVVSAMVALAAESGAELFQKAVTEERASGNLEEAIKLYQRVAKEFASDRPLAAKALVQAARCYEKLGQDKHDKAVKLYEQVARDFGDQREPSAAASARLAVLRQVDRTPAPATMTQRKIEMPGAFGYVATDGRRALYRDGATGALVISDLARKNQRVVFKVKPDDSFYFAPSRDLSVTYMSFRRAGDPKDTRAMIKTDGTSYHEVTGIDATVYPTPTWSWDNHYALVEAHFSDGTNRLLRITAADGSTQEVLRRNAPISKASYSPDGRFIAYTEGFSSGRVLVMPSQGGEPQLISERGILLDWTRDGRYLAIASAHSGATALLLVPVKDGKPAADPVFVRYGSFLFGITTSVGALLYQSYPEAATVDLAWIADLDPHGHPADWKRLMLGPHSGLWPVPAWSPDSGQIAWTGSNEDSGQSAYVVRLRNLASGKDRDLYRSAGVTVCTWAAGNSNLFCGEFTSGGTTDIISIAVDSGRTESLGSMTGDAYLLDVPSPDDQAVYFGHMQRGLLRWDIGTRQETPLDVWDGTFDAPRVSRDGGWLKRTAKGNLEVRSLSGGDWKSLQPLGSSTQSGFSPDGKWIFYHDVDAAAKDGLYRIATAGGTPERLGDFPANHLLDGMLSISPDGRKIIALAYNYKISLDTWMLENFEPKQQAAK